MHAIKQLACFGYKFSVQGGRLRYQHVEGGSTPASPATVQRLLSELAEHKAEAMAFLQANPVIPWPTAEETWEAWDADPNNRDLELVFVHAAIRDHWPYCDNGVDLGAAGWQDFAGIARAKVTTETEDAYWAAVEADKVRRAALDEFSIQEIRDELTERGINVQPVVVANVPT